MKAYPVSRPFILASLLLLIVTSSGCVIRALKPTSFLNDDQALVKDVKLVGIDKQYIETVYQYVQSGIRPNSKVNLYFYNLANTKKGKYRTDRIKKIGNAPNLLDSGLVEISRQQIEKYLTTKGFFKAKVKSEMAVKNKKAYITFTAERGPMFRFRNFAWNIADTGINRIYTENRDKITRIHTGKRYDRDSVQFEIDTIYALLKRKGYYDYLRQYAHVDVDTNLFSSQADLKLTISNPEDLKYHPVYTIDSTRITIATSEGDTTGSFKASLIDSQFYFKDFMGKFDTKNLRKYIYLKRGDLYNTERVNLTSNRMYDLSVFRTFKIDFEKTADSTHHLNAVLNAVPLKRMSNRIEGEYTFNSGRNGFNIGNTYTNRNLFGGAEQLDVKVRYGILFDSGVSGKAFSSVFNRDLQIGANLILPRLITPFNINATTRFGLPHTTFASSLQIFDQRNAFTNRIFINSLTYDWTESRPKLHSLTPIKFEFRRGRLDTAFKAQLQNGGYQLYISTNERNYISLGSLYSFTYNQVKLNSYQNFTYLKASTDVAGNTIGLISSVLDLNKVNGERTILGTSYLQYAKGEVDVRKYRSLGGERQLVARIDAGLAVPYANTKTLPFEKNFYGGGSGGIRAWQARFLGPGQYNRASIKDSVTRRNFRNLDQLGEIKIEGNLEYRYLLVPNFNGIKIKGAFFTDYGNIWRLRARDSINTPGGIFKFNTFYKQIAIGAGAGLRFDLDYFVFRFDVGAKIRDPQFVDKKYGQSPWVIGKIFDRHAFKGRYEMTNGPDTYRFLQYNFGIAMPF